MILSISLPFLAKICSINWACKYSVLQVADLQTFKRCLAASTGYQINYVFGVQVKVPLILYLYLVAWETKATIPWKKRFHLMNLPKFVKKSKWKQRYYHLRSQRDIKENTKETTLLFFAINVKTEGLGNQNEEDTIMNIKLYIVKKKGEWLKKPKKNKPRTECY